nr:MAG TPA: hypothetical protein [Caudoviricetes sp.]
MRHLSFLCFTLRGYCEQAVRPPPLPAAHH